MAESGLPASRENASYPPVSRRFPNGRNPPIPEVQMLWRMPYLATKLKTRTHDAHQVRFQPAPLASACSGWPEFAASTRLAAAEIGWPKRGRINTPMGFSPFLTAGITSGKQPSR
jgi:hypothetical protein